MAVKMRKEDEQTVDDRLVLPGVKPSKAAPVKPASEERKKIKIEKEVCHMCNAEKDPDNREPPFMATLVCSWCYKHEDRPENVKDKQAPKKDEAFFKSRVAFINDFLKVEQERMVKEQQASTDDEAKKIWQYKVDIVVDVIRSVGEILA